MKKFFKSFSYAFQGLREAFKEQNFSIQFVIGFGAIVLAVALPSLSDTERLLVVLCVALVLGSEALNSALERLLNFVAPHHHEEVRVIKDLMAATVLIFSSAAFVVGLWVFGKAFHFF
jgi:undecaprenol kinase